MISSQPLKGLLIASVFLLRMVGFVYGQNATAVNGLYYTGANNSGGLLAAGTTDPHWTVSYASIGGVKNSTYEGAAYVVNSTYITGTTVPNTSTAQWITAPGAGTNSAGANPNTGGYRLPGDGTSGANSAYYVYRLAFQIAGTGSGTVQNNVSITLTIAADDQYAVYVNPVSAPTVNVAGTVNAGGTASSGGIVTTAWDNTTSLALQNYGAGAANNAQFVIGTNYLYVVVANTNGLSGPGTNTTFRPSGLLMYQVGSAVTIGPPVPEVGAWLPVVLALGLCIRKRFFRGSARVANRSARL